MTLAHSHSHGAPSRSCECEYENRKSASANNGGHSHVNDSHGNSHGNSHGDSHEENGHAHGDDGPGHSHGEGDAHAHERDHDHDLGGGFHAHNHARKEHRGHRRARRDGSHMQYKRWAGKNRFFCCGRCMTGPDMCSHSITFSIIVIPAMLWLARIGPWYALRFGPGAVVVELVGFAHLVVSMVFMFMTTCRDPGIIPRQPAPVVTKSQAAPLPCREEIIDGERFILRYCDTCHIYRPPRAKHCRDCDNCVEEFDHHCPWMSNCIGKRNYKFFVLFLMNNIFFILFIITTCLVEIIVITVDLEEEGKDHDGVPSFFVALGMGPSAVILVLYCIVIFFPVISLLGFHRD